MERQTHEIWTYYDKDLVDRLSDHIVGYDVEALDGHLGTIDEVIHERAAAHLVVDTGPWIFGRKILLPAGIVSDIDDDWEKVFVNRSKAQVKNAPDYVSSLIADDTYRDELASYYGSGPGFQG